MRHRWELQTCWSLHGVAIADNDNDYMMIFTVVDLRHVKSFFYEKICRAHEIACRAQ